MTHPNAPILVVEDIPNVLDFLVIALRFRGYAVVSAGNGQEALEVVTRQTPSLIITDVLMPRMDGYTLAQRLRTNPQTSTIPIIFISATYVSPEDKAFALSLGIARFIEKPIDSEELLLTIAEVLAEPPVSPAPLELPQFYAGYRQRLESKLQYKDAQVARTERLMINLPDEQKVAFRGLLQQAVFDREQIARELERLDKILNSQGNS